MTEQNPGRDGASMLDPDWRKGNHGPRPCPVCGMLGGFHDHQRGALGHHRAHRVPRQLIRNAVDEGSRPEKIVTLYVGPELPGVRVSDDDRFR